MDPGPVLLGIAAAALLVAVAVAGGNAAARLFLEASEPRGRRHR